MFVIKDEDMRVPVKVWLPGADDLEAECLAQAKNLARHPKVFGRVVLCPDAHTGFGMPIGGVAPIDGAVIPNAVGVDIGCGMGFIHTNIPAQLLRDVDTPSGKLAQAIIGNIVRNVPTGKGGNHSKKQNCPVLDTARIDESVDSPVLLEAHEHAYKAVGTMGANNHFIELQEDHRGFLAIMIHSGSRHYGYAIANHFNKTAQALNEKWAVSLPSSDLAFLPVDTVEGDGYLRWMHNALDFARFNRTAIMEQAKNTVLNMVEKYAGFTGVVIDLEVNAHHNYAALEHHFGRDVWVHRKGAIRAREDEIGIIPGAMGSYSFIVRGLGNEESFMSCSHGAGRRMGRKEAARQYTTEQVALDFKAQGIAYTKPNVEEYREAYKDIDFVLANEVDLAEPVMRLKTVAVIKG